jgi:hypothetical protein
MRWEFTTVTAHFLVQILRYIAAVFKFAIMGQFYLTFYRGNLLPFHGKFQGTIALQHNMTVLPWHGSKLPW